MRSTLFLVIALCSSLYANAQSWLWAQAAGCPAFGGNSAGYLVQTDLEGNIYFSGHNGADSICIGPNTFHATIVPLGGIAQTIVAKYTSSGSLLWANSSDDGLSSPLDMAVDANGNLYVVGIFSTDSIRFGSYILTNQYPDTTYPIVNSCYYLIKYSPNGEVLWAKSGDNVSYITYDVNYLRITCDKDNNVYMCGSFNDQVLHIDNLSVSKNDSTDDMFIAKFNSDGDALWVKHFGGTGREGANGICINKDNKIYLTGFYDSPSFTLGNTTIYNTTNYVTPYIAKFDTTGNPIWARTAQGFAKSYDLIPDSVGNVYIAGTILTDNPVIFGIDTFSFPYQDHASFLIKYDTSGTIMWDKVLYPVSPPGVDNNEMTSLTIDACNNIWTSGILAPVGGMTLDSNTVLFATPPANIPAFMVEYSPEGNLLDYQSLATGRRLAISADMDGNIYCTGAQYLSPFTLGNSTFYLSQQVSNMFWAKYNPPTCAIPQKVHIINTPTIRIYPNPASDIMEIAGIQSATYTITIYDMSGRAIKHYRHYDNNTSIRVQDLQPGLYQCRIQDDQGNVMTRKLVIMR